MVQNTGLSLPPGGPRHLRGGRLRTMSRGIGKTQREILALLKETERGVLSVPEIALSINKSQRQIRAAVHSLENHGLVVLKKRSGGYQEKKGTRTVTGSHLWVDEENNLRYTKNPYSYSYDVKIPIDPTLFVRLSEKQAEAEVEAEQRWAEIRSAEAALLGK